MAVTADAGAVAELRRRAGDLDALRGALVDRLGVAPDAPVAVLGEALDRLLARPVVPEGAEVVDAPTLADLRDDAGRWRTRERDGALAAAIRDGRLRPADRATWEAILDADLASGTRALAALPRTIPVAAIGYSVDPEGSDDAVYGEFGPLFRGP